MASQIQIATLMGVAPAAQMTRRKWGVPASVTLAQWIYESSWGTSQLALKARNYFGIKAMQGQAYMEFPTDEVVRGSTIRELASFAVYPSAIESFDAHGRLLATLPRYQPAMAHADDPAGFAAALHICGYSTNPNYGLELTQAMRDYGLEAYDAPPPQPAVQEVAA